MSFLHFVIEGRYFSASLRNVLHFLNSTAKPQWRLPSDWLKFVKLIFQIMKYLKKWWPYFPGYWIFNDHESLKLPNNLSYFRPTKSSEFGSGDNGTCLQHCWQSSGHERSIDPTFDSWPKECHFEQYQYNQHRYDTRIESPVQSSRRFTQR